MTCVLMCRKCGCSDTHTGERDMERHRRQWPPPRQALSLGIVTVWVRPSPPRSENSFSFIGGDIYRAGPAPDVDSAGGPRGMAPSLLGADYHEPSSKKVIDKNHNANQVILPMRYSQWACRWAGHYPLSFRQAPGEPSDPWLSTLGGQTSCRLTTLSCLLENDRDALDSSNQLGSEQGE